MPNQRENVTRRAHYGSIAPGSLPAYAIAVGSFSLALLFFLISQAEARGLSDPCGWFYVAIALTVWIAGTGAGILAATLSALVVLWLSTSGSTTGTGGCSLASFLVVSAIAVLATAIGPWFRKWKGRN